jgi:acetyl esterase/lipase
MRLISLLLLMLAMGASSAAPVVPGVRRLAELDYSGNDHPRQKLDLYLPEKRVGDGPLPVIVFIHGGGWQNGDKAAGGRRLARLLQSGRYAGVSIGYRLTDEAKWPAQIHDCKAGIRWIRAHSAEYGLDPSRMVAFGPSAGGHLVAMLGVSGGDTSLEGTIGPHRGESSAVSAVIDFFGPTDFVTMAERPSGMRHDTATSPEGKLLGGAPKDVPQVAKEASPLHHVRGGEPPFLIVHGDADRIVPFGQSADFAAKLKKAGVEAALVTVGGGGHGQGFGPAVDKAVMAFLGKHLLGEEREIGDATVKARE